MGQTIPPSLQLPQGGIAYTGRGARKASVAALVSPRDPDPLGVRNTTLHRKPSHWMGATPHMPTNCRTPDLPAPLGPDTVPSWLEGPEPVSGNYPPGVVQGGGPGERGRPQVSPALLTKSCYCGPCLQGLVPGPPTLEVIGAGALWVPFYCPSQGWSLGLGSQ